MKRIAKDGTVYWHEEKPPGRCDPLFLFAVKGDHRDDEEDHRREAPGYLDRSGMSLHLDNIVMHPWGKSS